MAEGVKKLPILIIIFCIVSIIEWHLLNFGKVPYLPYYNYRHMDEENFVIVTKVEKITNKQLLLDTPGCKIEDLDPLDQSVRDIFQPLGPFECSTGEVNLVSVAQGKLYINSTAKENILAGVGLPPEDSEFLCCLRYIFRYSLTDDDSTYRTTDECIYFTDGNFTLTSSAVQIKCFVDGTVIYETYLYYPSKNSEETPEFLKQSATNDQYPSEDTLSVMILGMDSVSRLMFHRSLVKSTDVLQTLDAIEFLGYNRVGGNTFPCLAPLLTGKSKEDLVETCDVESNYLDECNFIWEEFSRLGYVTAYVEDYDVITTFTCGYEGFNKIPVDFYGKPFIKASSSAYYNSMSCIEGRSEDQLVYESALNYQRAFKDDPHFGFFWINRFSHDDSTKIQFIDPFLSQILTDMMTENLLNRTVLIILSDHGSRLDKLSELPIGEYELNLPILYFVFPKWYREKYPKKFENFYLNAGTRLTTLFDVHYTLKEILLGSSFNSSAKASSGNRGISLFESISELRSCLGAGIPTEYCACQMNEVFLDVGSGIVQQLSERAVNYLNSLTADQREICETYSLTEVIRLKALTRDDHLVWPFPDRTNFVLTLQVSPGNAKFEVVITYLLGSNDFIIEKNVKRVNKYGSSSHCVQDNARLKPICYCKYFETTDSAEYHDY